MKLTLTIVCVMFVLCAAGVVKPSSPKTAFSEAELRELAKSAPDVKGAGSLYQVALATNNVELRQEYLKASAACLFACGRVDVYQKYIKGKLQKVAEIENSLKETCGQCSGKGKIDRRCNSCNRSGRCTLCKGSGQTVRWSLSGANGEKLCHKCNGSGHCQKCGGKGSTKEKCWTCSGTGKVFSKAVAVRVFRDTCNAIADGCAAEARAKVEAERRERERREMKSSGQHTENNSKKQVKSQEMPQHSNLSGGDEVRKAKELYAKRCKASGGEAEVEYSGVRFVRFAMLKNDNGMANFLITYHRQNGDRPFAVLPPQCPPEEWYMAIEECAEKIKEWFIVAKMNKVKHVCKEIPIYEIYGINVTAYPGCITAGRGQAKLFGKATRDTYSLDISECVKFIGAVRSRDDNFERFEVEIIMECGEYFNAVLFDLFSSVGTA